jgi:hypothetical protein
LLDFQQHGIFEHAEAMTTAHGNRNIACSQFARGDKLASIVVDVNGTAPFPHDEDFRSANDMPFDGSVHMAMDLFVS